ncbi:MAG: histidine kinase [Desulfuromonas sp.]|nr:MAG: histidine kinase [Desulfuromonas sp.]
MFKSVISRVILLNIILLALGIGILSLFHLHREQSHQIAATQNSARLLLATIEKSIFNSMRLGNSAEVQAILELVGHSHALEGVRIFSPSGQILKSADPDEIGHWVSPQDFSLFQQNAKEGVFQSKNGPRVLSMVRPIVSDKRCFKCHGQGRKVIGVLNMNFSLREMYSQLREISQMFVISTLAIIVLLAAGMSYIMIRLLRRPLERITSCMWKVEEGDLTVRMTPKNNDEVGRLMLGFNAMVGNLELAQTELQNCHYQQMERADRLASIGEMAAGLAHEIKNPLAGISGAISVLADDYTADDPRSEVFSQIQDQIGRLDKTVTDLLYFGRPGQPEFSYADLNSLLKQTLLFVAQHPEARNIGRVEELTKNLSPVWVDQKQIQQVLLNVCINALQAMDGSGMLSVETKTVEHDGKAWVRAEIRDNGPGMAPAVLEQIFTPFFTTKTQGTGLGLPICRQLMENNNGTLQVESHLGRGSCFILELPVLENVEIVEGGRVEAL